jgi:hypothetical protein
MRKGIFASMECSGCEIELVNVEDDLFYIFNCGHTYHQICVCVVRDEPVCVKCFKIDQILIMLVNNIFHKNDKLNLQNYNNLNTDGSRVSSVEN